MQPAQNPDAYKILLTEVLKRQIRVLGPSITLTKARNVKGLTIADDGTVTGITGDEEAITQALVNQFSELSPLIVEKTMHQLMGPGYESPQHIQAPRIVPESKSEHPLNDTTSKPIAQDQVHPGDSV